jgi:hypothetical protein
MSDTKNTTTIARGNKRLTLAVQPGYTAEQIVTLLNTYKANVQGRQIVQHMPPPYEGFSVLAEVVATAEDPDTAQWAVVPTDR